MDRRLYIVAQVLGGLIGVWAAHTMFERPVWQLSMTARSGTGQRLAEAVATFGLLLTIFGCISRRPEATAYAVELSIRSAYWFASSPSFAKTAVTIVRSLSDTFDGISPPSVTAFIIAQSVGMPAAVALGRWLWRKDV